MKNKLNLNINNKVIKIVDSCDFIFLEEDINFASPVDQYYFKIYDLSINVKIKLKWILYGYFFLKSIEQEINDVEEFDKIIEGSLSKDIEINFKDKKIEIDDIDMTDINFFISEVNNEYNKVYYDENSVIHLKLKLNILEFLILQNTAYPRLTF